MLSSGRICGSLLSGALVLAPAVAAQAGGTAAASSAAEAPADSGWPRVFTQGDRKVVLYQPQIDDWPGFSQVDLRMAVAVTPDAAKPPVYGVVQVHATTQVDHDTRTVLVTAPQRTVRFPNLPADQAAALEDMLKQAVPPQASMTVSLDRGLAYMKPDTAGPAAGAAKLNLDPPAIFYSEQPAILLGFQGRPRFKPIQDAPLLAAINANWDVFLDPATGTYYLLDTAHGTSWLQTRDPVAGPWAPAGPLPDAFTDLPAGESWAHVRSALPAPGAAPPIGQAVKVFASTAPAELIVLDGEPELEPISGTQLMAVANTDSVLFKHLGDGTWYYLVAGRWFSAAATSGPWTAATARLPADFAQIPADDPRAAVLDSVPGTTEASDAVLLAEVPHTATVDPKALTLDVTWAGAPTFAPIPPTTIQYGVNTPMSVLQVAGSFLCCHQGVWFTAPAATGPWSVATSVPDVVYTIPPTSPMYPVTFVRVYGTTPDAITVGYTSGYDGEYVSQAGTLMFGLGVIAGEEQEDEDDDDWDAYYHYGPAWYSYGCGAVYAGYAYGCWYRGGAAYGPYAGAARATAWNPVTGAWASAGYVRRPAGSAAYRAGYNPATDTAAARVGGTDAYGAWSRGVATRGDAWVAGGQKSTAAGSAAWVQTSAGGAAVGVQTARGTAYAGKTAEGDVYAGRDGNVYKRGDDGSWQQHDGSGWVTPHADAGAAATPADKAAPARGAERTASASTGGLQQASKSDLDQAASSRQLGNTRSMQFQSRGSFSGFRGRR